MKQVTCKSGLKGWQGKLQDVYVDAMQFEEFCAVYGIHTRLGFSSVMACWRANPTVQGSVNPSDLRRVKRRSVRKPHMSVQQRRDEKHVLYGELEDVAN